MRACIDVTPATFGLLAKGESIAARAVAHLPFISFEICEPETVITDGC